MFSSMDEVYTSFPFADTVHDDSANHRICFPLPKGCAHKRGAPSASSFDSLVMYVSEASTTNSLDMHAPTKVGGYPLPRNEYRIYVKTPLALHKVIAKDDRRKLSFFKDIVPGYLKSTAAKVNEVLYPKVEPVNMFPWDDQLMEE